MNLRKIYHRLTGKIIENGHPDETEALLAENELIYLGKIVKARAPRVREQITALKRAKKKGDNNVKE